MIQFVNAKINLGLNVTAKRPDGYHDLETIFYPVGKYCGTPLDPGTLCDVIEICESDADRFEAKGLVVDCPLEKNLVWKALAAFRKAIETIGVTLKPVNITLEKHLPFGAGIGGGSADAAFTLRMLNELAGSPLSQQALIDLSASLGADCPFFILNTPAAAEGIGEILAPIALSLEGKWTLIVKPEVSISTGEAFSKITPKKPATPLTEVITHPIEEWKELMHNDFEVSAFSLYPTLGALKQSLYKSGAIYASMSGSGSSFFGIYPSKETALQALSYPDFAALPFATICKL